MSCGETKLSSIRGKISTRNDVKAAGSDARKQWSAIKDVLHLTESNDIFPADYCQNLCDNFAKFFAAKIRSLKTNIRIRLVGQQGDPLESDPKFTGQPMHVILPPSVDEIRRLIGAMPAKSSPLDAIPTSALKTCIDVFAPIIARLARLSFSEGKFPEHYKSASVTPLLKKKGVDIDDVTNYRPISNLHTISKIVERIFMSRVLAHVERSPCFNKYQSAYRRGHSTETALFRTLN